MKRGNSLARLSCASHSFEVEVTVIKSVALLSCKLYVALLDRLGMLIINLLCRKYCVEDNDKKC